MKATDLMVGDWVINTISNEPRQIKTPSELNYARIMEPIPLTEEILVKNGFEKTWNGDWQLKEYSTIIISKDYYVKIFERSIRVDYVHELQHLLHTACVDKELVID